jgi:hypothetical protein
MRVSAFREALSRFDHGLALLANEPSLEERSSAERDEDRRLLEVARLGPQRTLEGVGSAMLDGALTRATEAGKAAVGGDAASRPALAALWRQAERLTVTGRFEEAHALAERMQAEATQSGEEDLAGLPQYYCGAVLQGWQMGRSSAGTVRRPVVEEERDLAREVGFPGEIDPSRTRRDHRPRFPAAIDFCYHLGRPPVATRRLDRQANGPE